MSRNWNRKVEAIQKRYAKRIEAVLQNIIDALTEAGFRCDGRPSDMSCDDYRWSFLVYLESNPDDADHELSERDVDITLQICESTDFEGTEDGITFTLDIVAVGGRILGGMSPYNYTSDVWVNLDDAEGIEERFSYFEQADADGIVDILAGANV